jgi:hypothetical protein
MRGLALWRSDSRERGRDMPTLDRLQFLKLAAAMGATGIWMGLGMTPCASVMRWWLTSCAFRGRLSGVPWWMAGRCAIGPAMWSLLGDGETARMRQSVLIGIRD